MSLRLPTTSLDPSDVGSEDENCTSSSSEEEETWSDWVSDSMNKQPCQSLFEEKTLPAVSEALAYDRKEHGFDLPTVCSKLCTLASTVTYLSLPNFRFSTRFPRAYQTHQLYSQRSVWNPLSYLDVTSTQYINSETHGGKSTRSKRKRIFLFIRRLPAPRLGR